MAFDNNTRDREKGDPVPVISTHVVCIQSIQFPSPVVPDRKMEPKEMLLLLL
jgi:hypothetical protein